MNKQYKPEIPKGKYNMWGERRPLVCKDEKLLFSTDKYLSDNNLTFNEKATYYTHDLVGCEGLEFVVFGNVYLKQPITLPGNITLFPCFLGKIVDTKNPLAKITLNMIKKARFVYDGWIPIDDWQLINVRKKIRDIDSALSIFALQASASFSWETKYTMLNRTDNFYEYEKHNTSELDELTKIISNMKEKDALYLLSSIGWLSQAIKLKEPAARFLFCMLAIESLATYIEESKDDSIFKAIKCEKLSTEERKRQKENCIRAILANSSDNDLENKIRMAYFDCVVGIKNRLQNHIRNIMPEEGRIIDSLFNTKIDGKTLYDIRHEIAHGRMDSLSEIQKGEVNKRSEELEAISRKYLVKIIQQSTGFNISGYQTERSIGFNMFDNVYQDETMYNGPRSMAILYSQSFEESVTLPRIR